MGAVLRSTKFVQSLRVDLEQHGCGVWRPPRRLFIYKPRICGLLLCGNSNLIFSINEAHLWRTQPTKGRMGTTTGGVGPSVAVSHSLVCFPPRGQNVGQVAADIRAQDREPAGGCRKRALQWTRSEPRTRARPFQDPASPLGIMTLVSEPAVWGVGGRSRFMET